MNYERNRVSLKDVGLFICIVLIIAAGDWGYKEYNRRKVYAQEREVELYRIKFYSEAFDLKYSEEEVKKQLKYPNLVVDIAFTPTEYQPGKPGNTRETLQNFNDNLFRNPKYTHDKSALAERGFTQEYTINDILYDYPKMREVFHYLHTEENSIAHKNRHSITFTPYPSKKEALTTPTETKQE